MKSSISTREDRCQHTYSTEILRHYRCWNCRGWWSIADDPTPEGGFLSCPKCGARGQVQEAGDEE